MYNSNLRSNETLSNTYNLQFMRQVIFYFLLTILLAIAACSELDIPSYSGRTELYFEKYFIDEIAPGTAESDSTMASFFFTPDNINEIKVPLVVYLSGQIPTSDLNFKLRVVDEETTANEDEYHLDDSYVFSVPTLVEGRNYIVDTIQITMLRSQRLEENPNGVRLTLELVSDKTIGVGQFERSRAVIILTKDAVRPLWWNKEVETVLLGIYSSKKYKLFLQNVPGSENLDQNMIENSPDQAIKLVRSFKKWLSEQNPQITEEDGSLMRVEV